MSIFDGIARVVGIPTAAGGSVMPTSPTAGPAPVGSATAPASGTKLNGFFQSAFQRNMQTVFDRGLAGEFDDPALAMKEQAAIARLAAARKELAASSPITGGGAAAPRPTTDTTAPTTGKSTAGAPTPTDEVRAEHDIYSVRLSQSEARLTNISTKLRSEYPAAAALASASTGTWDPASYEPRTKEQAAAFAQRMVIDVTEGAARLEIVKNQLDDARLDANTNATPAALQLVKKLEADFDRQQAYVQKLASIVDRTAHGVMAEAGTAALAGHTKRSAHDLPVSELAEELRATGMSEEDVTRVVGANEAAVDEEATPGGSKLLQQAVDSLTFGFIQKMEQRRTEARQRFEEHRREEQRADQRAQSRHLERRRDQQTSDQQAAANRQQAEQADFQQYLARLQQQRTG